MSCRRVVRDSTRDTIARGIRIVPPARRRRRATARRSAPTARRSSRHAGARCPRPLLTWRRSALSIRQLDELFMIVVVGEFNAGKSAFVNALLGDRIFDEGVTPTTARIQRFGMARRPHPATTTAACVVVTAPVELLRDLQIVDTPGHQRHRSRTRTADARVRAARRSGPVRHLGRSAVHRKRAGVPRDDSRLGQEDRHRRQQGRHLRERATSSRRCSTFVDQAPRAICSGVDARAVRRQRAAGLARQARRPRAVGGQRLSPRWKRSCATRSTTSERFRLKLASPLGVGSALARALRDARRRSARPAVGRHRGARRRRRGSWRSTARISSAASSCA